MTSGNGTEGTTNVNPQEVAADLAKSVDKATRKVVSLTDKGPIKGFKKFISRGSMIDMAVGVVMGSAVTTVVNAIVNHLISPLIGMVGGVPDMSGVLTITFNGATSPSAQFSMPSSTSCSSAWPCISASCCRSTRFAT